MSTKVNLLNIRTGLSLCGYFSPFGEQTVHKGSPLWRKFPQGGVVLKYKKYIGSGIAGLCAGAVNGLFGAGGGMVLVPLLTIAAKLEDDEVFPSSVTIILPICLVSLALSWPQGGPDWSNALPYLLGSALGGLAAGLWGQRIPTKWLHRILGLLILWGGFRYLC